MKAGKETNRASGVEKNDVTPTGSSLSEMDDTWPDSRRAAAAATEW